MPKLKNVTKRTFIIAGKELPPHSSITVSLSVAERHARMYPNELFMVEDDVCPAVEAVAVPTHIAVVPEGEGDEGCFIIEAPKKRGRKPKGN